jgi:hypothetical protein
VLADCVAIVAICTLIGLGRMTAAEGLPWLAALLAGRLVPRKGSGVATLVATLWHR